MFTENVTKVVHNGISHGEKFISVISKQQDSQIMLFLIGLIVMHLIADFILSPRINNEHYCKRRADSKFRWKNFFIHCGIYATLMFNYCVLSSYIFFDLLTLTREKVILLMSVQLLFSGVNILSHAFVDLLIFPIKERLYGCDRYNDFMITLGIDQIIHVCFLMYTANVYIQFLLENFVAISSFCLPVK